MRTGSEQTHNKEWDTVFSSTISAIMDRAVVLLHSPLEFLI